MNEIDNQAHRLRDRLKWWSGRGTMKSKKKPERKKVRRVAIRPHCCVGGRVAKEVCDDLVWASWLQSVSPKAQHEIRAAVRKLAKHFKLQGYYK